MNKNKSPWLWVPPLYFAEGLPYVIVNVLSVIMYKKLEVSNTDIALYTSWLYFPWVIKPFWSPIVELLKTTRCWIVLMQFVMGVGFACVAFTLPLDNFFQFSLAIFWLVAFGSATHDIAADGFYMIALDESRQSLFIGIRNTFYRLAMLSGQGLIVVMAGKLELILPIKTAWLITIMVLGGVMVLFSIYLKLAMPFPETEQEKAGIKGVKNALNEFLKVFIDFFKKKEIGLIIAFLLLFRLGEGQLVKLATPFLLDTRETGGLNIDTETVGWIYGTAGMIALTVGGILGGVVASKNGLKFWIWWMMLAVNLPNLAYVFLASYQPESVYLVYLAVLVEQFGYGFGFTAFVLYLIFMAGGKHKTAHYAIGTGFMALGMMLPGMVSGAIQEFLGYKYFFIWIVLCGLPAFVVAYFLKIDPDFGKEKKESK